MQNRTLSRDLEIRSNSSELVVGGGITLEGIMESGGVTVGTNETTPRSASASPAHDSPRALAIKHAKQLASVVEAIMALEALPDTDVTDETEQRMNDLESERLRCFHNTMAFVKAATMVFNVVEAKNIAKTVAG